MRRRAFLGTLVTMAGSLAVEQAWAQGLGHRLGHFAGSGSYSHCNYWTPRVYPIVACCHGVTRFEQPPGAAYPVCLKKYRNPDFVGYHGAYSGYERAPQVLPVASQPIPTNAPTDDAELGPAPRGN